MPEGRLGGVRWAAIAGLWLLTVGLGLGGAERLTYHEAFVAQAARELNAGGSALITTIDGQPWLEKPPLATWLVALSGRLGGGIDEFSARVPSALAALALSLGLSLMTARRLGSTVGWLAGLIQVTTYWLVVRGRLAEADILLACLVTWLMLVFDRLRTDPQVLRTSNPSATPSLRGPHRLVARQVLQLAGRGAASRRRRPEGSETAVVSTAPLAQEPAPDVAPVAVTDPAIANPQRNWGALGWRAAFFAILGLTSLVKGLGFGAVLAGSAIGFVLLWDRDGQATRKLKSPAGWILAGLLALTWPLLVAFRLPASLSLWTLHVTDRLSSHPEVFIGGSSPWWQYGPAVLAQALPWTPLALVGAWPSLVSAVRGRGRGGFDRLLWAWAVTPLIILSMATVKNNHYAIYAMPPLSVWAALGLLRVMQRLEHRRGWPLVRLKAGVAVLFVTLGLGWGLGHALMGPRLDRRGQEWTWTAEVGQQVPASQPLAFLYEDWDRKPYPTPFGPMPHDWAVRLFYLNRHAVWRQGVEGLAERPPSADAYLLVGRERDLAGLQNLGHVETLGKSPADRFDRDFRLYRVTPPRLSRFHDLTVKGTADAGFEKR